MDLLVVVVFILTGWLLCLLLCASFANLFSFDCLRVVVVELCVA